MNYLRVIALLGLGFAVPAQADVWKWVDANGKTHYVDTMKPIYTWVDEFGKVHYSDTPDHEDAVTAELAWHSPASLDEVPDDDEDASRDIAPDAESQTAADPAESFYCKRATEIYESYVNAPQLYRTGPDGEREFLSEEEAAKTIAETRARKEELCAPTLASGD